MSSRLIVVVTSPYNPAATVQITPNFPIRKQVGLVTRNKQTLEPQQKILTDKLELVIRRVMKETSVTQVLFGDDYLAFSLEPSNVDSLAAYFRSLFLSLEVAYGKPPEVYVLRQGGDSASQDICAALKVVCPNARNLDRWSDLGSSSSPELASN
jgi:hypothetical protein